MNNYPLFSVLIANYNNGLFFYDCYKSLIDQEYQNFEVIIVDDCSTDNSVEIINNLIKNDNRFHIYQNSINSGAGFTKRKCVELAHGTICGFVDPDDAITTNAIKVMVDAHRAHPTTSLIYSQFIQCDENLREISYFKSKQVKNNVKDFFNTEGLITHFTTFLKSHYLQTEGINPYLKRAVDQDLYLKMYEGGSVLFIDKHLYRYRIHNGGISTNSNSSKAFFWHWIVMIDAAKRRNINIEEKFVNEFIDCKAYHLVHNKLEIIKKSRILKLLNKIGLFKAYKYL